MQPAPKYAALFVGYSAQIFGTKAGRQIEYAMLDFAQGTTRLNTEGGSIVAPDLATVINGMPDVLAELELLVKELGSSSTNRSAQRGPYRAIGSSQQSDIIIEISGTAELRLKRGVRLKQFIRNLTKRYQNLESVIAQAKAIGGSICRPPYEAHLVETMKTGMARVEYYGYGHFIDGWLHFHPERRSLLIEPQHDNTLAIGGLGKVRPLLPRF